MPYAMWVNITETRCTQEAKDRLLGHNPRTERATRTWVARSCHHFMA
jgi:hypothetical protein